MKLNLNDITFIIVTYQSENIIKNCLDSLPKDSKKIIVDNSNNINFSEDLKANYDNIEVILSKNIGMGAGNNVGIKNVVNDFALILNPDVILEKNAIDEIINASKSLDKFGIISPISDKPQYPNYQFDKNESYKFDNINPFKVKSVDGYSMLLNLKRLRKLFNFNFFDENFFLYLENDDFCKRLQLINENIYVVPKSKIHHLGGQAVDPRYEKEIELARNWHWMWSKFYYNNKHYGYLNAVTKILNNLISAFIKFSFFSITLNSYKRKIYYMRLSGLINSMIGKKSFFRAKLDN